MVEAGFEPAPADIIPDVPIEHDNARSMFDLFQQATKLKDRTDKAVKELGLKGDEIPKLYIVPERTGSIADDRDSLSVFGSIPASWSDSTIYYRNGPAETSRHISFRLPRPDDSVSENNFTYYSADYNDKGDQATITKRTNVGGPGHPGEEVYFKKTVNPRTIYFIRSIGRGAFVKAVDATAVQVDDLEARVAHYQATGEDISKELLAEGVEDLMGRLRDLRKDFPGLDTGEEVVWETDADETEPAVSRRMSIKSDSDQGWAFVIESESASKRNVQKFWWGTDALVPSHVFGKETKLKSINGEDVNETLRIASLTVTSTEDLKPFIELLGEVEDSLPTE